MTCTCCGAPYTRLNRQAWCARCRSDGYGHPHNCASWRDGWHSDRLDASVLARGCSVCGEAAVYRWEPKGGLALDAGVLRTYRCRTHPPIKEV